MAGISGQNEEIRKLKGDLEFMCDDNAHMQAEVHEWQAWCEQQGSSYHEAPDLHQEFQDCEDDVGEEKVTSTHHGCRLNLSLSGFVNRPTVKEFP